MASEQLVFRLYKLHLIALYRERNPLAPFSWIVKRGDVKGECYYFKLEKRKVETVWGSRFPFCSHPTHVNHHARDKHSILSCKDCPLFTEEESGTAHNNNNRINPHRSL